MEIDKSSPGSNKNNIEESRKRLTQAEREAILEEMQKLKEEMTVLRREIEKQKALALSEEEEGDKEDEVEQEETEKAEELIEDGVEKIKEENEKRIKKVFSILKPKLEKLNQKTRGQIEKALGGTKKILRHKLVRRVALPIGILSVVLLSLDSPQGYYQKYQNFKERNWEKREQNDPNIRGINAFYNDSTTVVERSTYDFLGSEKIPYKFGYYMTSVFDLTDRTPPRFKLLNDRNNYSRIDSAAGITTNLFKPFQQYNEFKPELRGHTGKSPEEEREIPVIGFNKRTQQMRAGHLKDFDENWIVSETYEIPLNFELNPDSTINLKYHGQAMRMTPITHDEKGREMFFPIGITYDKTKTTYNPYEATSFGVLEGGKVILVCGEKQLQVNGSFADIYRVYERLKTEHPSQPINAYLLDNGSYNLPIWNKDEIITPEEINMHMQRHYDGGTALIMINDERISPFEYKNEYEEIWHYTPNYTLDSLTAKPAKNDKTVIVLHHTGNYPDPSLIIRQFTDTTRAVSSHVLIMKDGTRHLFNNDNYVLAHAGKSVFNDRNKVNFFSLGVELEGDSREGQFTLAQLESLMEYIRPRVEKYGIPFENITTHKIIRENYAQTFPEDKGVLNKIDLQDNVWEQIKDLIKKKVYEKIDFADNENGAFLMGALEYENALRETGNSESALERVREMLYTFNVPDEKIDSILSSIYTRN